MTAAPEAPGSFPGASHKLDELQHKNKFIKIRCVEHGEKVCATAALENIWKGFQNIQEAFWKLSGSFLEAKAFRRAPGARSALALGILHVFNTPERRTLARAAEPRIVRGAHLVRFHAKLNHAVGKHRNKHHVLWFRPDEDDNVRGARLSVFGRFKYQFAFSDLPVRVFSVCQFVFSAFFAFSLLLLPWKLPEAFWKPSRSFPPKIF